ncbi:hypothetical protein H4Q26_017517 [Puccinia striiformis f. sp. tritici PST-130]|nr:hypothetical protein H4Q26_017517 [Puccinia striiformis f. sp. tritici PST-130]
MILPASTLWRTNAVRASALQVNDHGGDNCKSADGQLDRFHFQELRVAQIKPSTIDDEEAFTRWITEIKRSCQGRGVVEVRMENPKDEVKKANKEELVARTIQQMEACRTGPLNRKSRVSGASNWPSTAFDVDSEEEGSSGPDFTVLDNQINEIYQKYGMNTEYDRIHPVYLNPLDTDQYILLTPGNVEIWAKALVDHIARVSLVSPPNTIKYLSRRKQRGSKA